MTTTTARIRSFAAIFAAACSTASFACDAQPGASAEATASATGSLAASPSTAPTGSTTAAPSASAADSCQGCYWHTAPTPDERKMLSHHTPLPSKDGCYATESVEGTMHVNRRQCEARCCPAGAKSSAR